MVTVPAVDGGRSVFDDVTPCCATWELRLVPWVEMVTSFRLLSAGKGFLSCLVDHNFHLVYLMAQKH